MELNFKGKSEYRLKWICKMYLIITYLSIKKVNHRNILY